MKYKLIYLSTLVSLLVAGCPAKYSNLPPLEPVQIDLEKDIIKPEPVLPETLVNYIEFDHNNYKEFYYHIETIALEQDLDPDLIRAIIIAESKFDIRAGSYKGAKGLMQLISKTAKEVGCKDRLDPIENMTGGTIYLKKLLIYFKQDIRLSVAAYNAGPNAVKRFGGIPPYKETRRYVKIVLEIYKILKDDDKRQMAYGNISSSSLIR